MLLQALQVAVKLEGDVITSNGSILSGYEGHDGQSLNGTNTSSMCSCRCICLNGNRHKKYVILHAHFDLDLVVEASDKAYNGIGQLVSLKAQQVIKLVCVCACARFAFSLLRFLSI